MKTNYIRPEIGQTYKLQNGGEYKCLAVSNAEGVEQGECKAILIETKSHWMLTVQGMKSIKGMVDWDFTYDGHAASDEFEYDAEFEIPPESQNYIKKISTSLESRIQAAEQKAGTVQTEAPAKENER